MMKRSLFGLCAAWISLLLVTPLHAGEAVTLRYKMTPGDKLLYRTKTTVKQSQTLQGKEFKNEMTTTDISERTFEKLDKKGNFQIKSENKVMKVDFDLGLAGKFTFDSKSEDRDAGGLLSGSLNPLYERMTGAILDVTLSPLGEVVAVKGYKELMADLLKDNPIATQFAGGGSDKAAKLGMADQYVLFSKKPVKPGDTWESTFEMELPKLGKAKGKRIYRYEGPDKVGDTKTAKISVTIEMSFDLDLNAEGNKTTGTVSIDNSSGTIQFDPAKGQIISAKSSQALSGEFTVDVNGQTFTIGIEQTQETQVDRLDKLPK